MVLIHRKKTDESVGHHQSYRACLEYCGDDDCGGGGGDDDHDDDDDDDDDDDN